MAHISNQRPLLLRRYCSFRGSVARTRCLSSSVLNMPVVKKIVEYECDGTVLKGYAAFVNDNSQEKKVRFCQ